MSQNKCCIDFLNKIGYNGKTKSTQISPVFDCGSCLLPQADEQTMQTILQEPQQLDARVYQFPNSATKKQTAFFCAVCFWFYL